jgi:hypothetical protein
MKKIITLVLLLLALIYPINIIHANVTEPEQFVGSESVELISKGFVAFSNVTFNMSNHMSSGYSTLVMGSSTTYTINLSTVTQYLQHYSAGNVSNVYLQFDLQAVYTGYTASEYQWLSSNGNWNSNNKRLALGTSLPTSAAAEIWWNVIGQSGGAPSYTSGALRIYTITLVIEYTTPVTVYDQISDWSELPSGTKPFNSYETYEDFETTTNMITVDLVENGTNYDIYFDFGDDKFVAINVTLPSKVTTKDIVFTRFFATSDAKFLWFFFNLNPSNPYNSDFLIWNLQTGEYQEVITGTVYGMPYVTGNGISTYNMAYTDLVIPWELESIVQVTMSYQYRYHYLFTGYGAWQTVSSQSLYEGALTNTKAPWWNPFARFYYNWNPIANFVGITDLWDVNQIENVTSSYNLEKKTTFVNFINEQANMSLTMNEIFPAGATVGKIFLGQFDKFGSNGVQIKDVVVLNIRYMIDGVEYSAVYPPQIIPDPEAPFPDVLTPLEKLFNEIWKIISSLYIVFCVVVGLIGSKFTYSFLPGKTSGSVKGYVILAIIYAAILYMSYQPPNLIIR